MKKLKPFFDLFPAMLLWLMLSIFLWGFVFSALTDIPAGERISLFVDAPLTEETRLATTLEQAVTAPVRAVQVRSFSYAMMGSDEIEQADLYIVTTEDVETYREWFAPLPEELQAQADLLLDGQPYGIKVYDAATQTGAALETIRYGNEDYYLLFGANSAHTADRQAAACALMLLDQPQGGNRP